MGKKRTKTAGFTLIELMVTIAVAAIILTIGIPSFSEIISNNRLVTQTNAFTTSLAVARSEAIKRSVQVTVCKSADGSSCTTSGNWEQGWVVFADSDGDGSIDTGEDILRVNNGIDSGYTLRTDASFSDWIAYSRLGLGTGSGGSSGQFRLCTPAADTAKARTIDINVTGRASLSQGASACP